MRSAALYGCLQRCKGDHAAELILFCCNTQAGASDREIAHAAAEAAEAAFDEVADAELAHRGATTGGVPAAAFAVSDAVLHQRTYFVPTMVRLMRIFLLEVC